MRWIFSTFTKIVIFCIVFNIIAVNYTHIDSYHIFANPFIKHIDCVIHSLIDKDALNIGDDTFFDISNFG